MKRVVRIPFLLALYPMFIFGAAEEEKPVIRSVGEWAQIFRNKPQGLSMDAAKDAADKGDLEAIKSLVDVKQLGVNDQDKRGGTLLRYIARRTNVNSFNIPSIYDKKYAIAQWLLENGANPNIRAKFGNTAALHEAVDNNDKKMVQLLVQHGADVNLPDLYERKTPLHIAVNRFSPDRAMIQLLLGLGADRNKANKHGHKPFD